jgi:hypothetical protein
MSRGALLVWLALALIVASAVLPIPINLFGG